MYFDLTKKQFKEYEKKFRKTYIGKKIFTEYVLVTVFACLVCLPILFLDLFSNSFTTNEIRLIISTCFIGLMLFFGDLYYEKLYYLELKDYIKSQKK